MSDEALAFLRPLINRPPYSHRPWVTLTYAQSLDGKLAGAQGSQIQLSGKESKAMTHRSVSCSSTSVGPYLELTSLFCSAGQAANDAQRDHDRDRDAVERRPPVERFVSSLLPEEQRLF